MKKIIHLFIVIIMVVAIVAVYYIGEKRLNSGSNLQNTILAEKPKVSTIVSINTPVNKSKVVDGSLEETESRNEIRKRNILFRKNKTTDASGLDQYNDKPIPILMYHSIAYEKGNDARIPIEKFREQMKFLKDNGYNTLTLTELSDLFTKNIPVPKKSVVLTFDDGYVDNYTNALPILKEFGIKATVFVITDWVDKVPQYMTVAQLKKMDENGIDIQAHTKNHDELDKLTYDKQVETLKGSKEFIEKNLNKKVSFMAYPFGLYNKTTIKAVADSGYTVALKMAGGWSQKENGMLTLNRIFIGANDSIDAFKNKISIPVYK